MKRGRKGVERERNGLPRLRPAATSPVPEHQVRAEFDYDGGGLAKGGSVTLYIDGEAVGNGRVDATQPMAFSGDETTDVGHDSATSVTDDFTSADSNFNGRVRWVQIDLGEDAEDADHYITAEERLRVAMAIQ